MDKHEADLTAIAGRRWSLSIVLSCIMLTFYVGFILLVAFNKPLLATPLADGLSLGILLGASVIVSAWVLTIVYVVWANTVYDPEINRIITALEDRA